MGLRLNLSEIFWQRFSYTFLSFSLLRSTSVYILSLWKTLEWRHKIISWMLVSFDNKACVQDWTGRWGKERFAYSVSSTGRATKSWGDIFLPITFHLVSVILHAFLLLCFCDCCYTYSKIMNLQSIYALGRIFFDRIYNVIQLIDLWSRFYSEKVWHVEGISKISFNKMLSSEFGAK